VNALVLAGGRSERMGIDKGMILWHGVPQRYWLADLLHSLGCNTFISCRRDQAATIDKRYQVLRDAHEDRGPFGALLTAFEFDRHSSWLMVACDLPFIDAPVIELLISARGSSKMATAFINSSDGSPEPMISIWEPACYDVLASSNHSSLRRILQTGNVKLIALDNQQALMNVNTPGECERVKDMMKEL
jgi:molybdopterin-guanine dinucleotide biosynthesis protein A